MVSDILGLIPKHKVYVEPFFGGGAVFWAKPPSDIEVINDYNGNVVNFYQTLQQRYVELRAKIEATLHSRETYKAAMVVYTCPWLFDEITRAWAFFVVTNQGFSGQIGSWSSDIKKRSRTLQNRVKSFTQDLADRLKLVQVENNFAHHIIQLRDGRETFFYLDPPYIGCNQWHYGWYAQEHFERDLDALVGLEWKFLLSTYPSPILHGYTVANGWYSKTINKAKSAYHIKDGGQRTRRIEVLTANYPLN